MSIPVPILADGIAPPAGHYAHAVLHGGLVYVSGMLPVPPNGVHRSDASFTEQARRALANLDAVLVAAGSRPDHLIKVVVHVVSIDHWLAFDAVYREWVNDTRPARVVVPVPALHHGYLIELDAIAAVAE